MGDFGLGAGMAALAFWGFVAVVTVGGMWYSIREKEIRQETLLRLIESGKITDDEMLKQITSRNSNEYLDRDLRVAAWIVLPISIGLAIFGFILQGQAPEAFRPLVGAGILVFFVGAGLLIAANIASKSAEDD